jgi:hypothetical protein
MKSSGGTSILVCGNLYASCIHTGHTAFLAIPGNVGEYGYSNRSQQQAQESDRYDVSTIMFER